MVSPAFEPPDSYLPHQLCRAGQEHYAQADVEPPLQALVVQAPFTLLPDIVNNVVLHTCPPQRLLPGTLLTYYTALV